MPLYYKGLVLTIERTEGALDSQREAESQVPPNRCACIQQMDALIKRLGDIGRLKVPDHFVDEGDGICAIKTRCGLRAYGWYHRKRRGVFVISHYIMKKWQKMKPADKDRAERNRIRYEDGDHE